MREKVQPGAAGGPGQGPEKSTTASLRAFWEERITEVRQAHGDGADGLEVARRLAATMDAVVHAAYEKGLEQTTGDAHALVALGGYGRQEMAPYSDVDLLFLFRREKDKTPGFIAGVLHPLWDLGFEIGHSSRTLREVGKMAREDLESCTSMMDGRFLAGDPDLFDDFQRYLYKQVPRSMVAKLHKGRQAREGSNGSVQLLEPNLKESPGGLREFHALNWALKGKAASPEVEGLRRQCLDDQDIATLEQGREFLCRVRHELHFVAGRRHDVLQHEIQPDVARSLGYEAQGVELAVERFMQDYYVHARAVYHLVDLAFERLTRKPRNPYRSVWVDIGVMAIQGEIVLRQGEGYFESDPHRLLSIFQLAQTKKLRLSEETQRTIRASLHLIDDELRRSEEARDVFMRILKRKSRSAGTLRLMHDLGVLGAYLPEFGALTCLVQYDIYHIYTVDEHILVALENLEALALSERQTSLKRIFVEFQRRDLLNLGVLLHDIGKSRRQEHISCGVEMAAEILQRLGVSEADQRFLLFLVEHHQDMVLISQRRDLDDYKMIAEFAGLFSSMEELQALYLLSYADLSAVASDAWTEWEGVLLWELYHKTSEQLESGMKTLEDKQQGREVLEEHLRRITPTWPALKVVAFQEHAQQLPPRYLAAYDHEQITAHVELIGRLGAGVVEVDFAEHQAHTEVVVCARDQRQLLAKICGVLAVHDIYILRADVHTRDDHMVLDIFQVTDVGGDPALPEWKKERVGQQLEEVISGRQKMDQLFSRYSTRWDRRQRNVQERSPEVDFENQVSDRYTVVDTDVQDDVGLLYKITYALGELELDIHMAIINTVANRALDAFYVVDAQGEKIVNYEILEQIRERLLADLAQ